MGILYVVATPIGNLNDITTNALNILSEVDIIACEDTRTSSNLLNHFNIKTKLVSYHKFNELNRSFSLIDDIKNGKNVAIITDAGTPCISDPGGILVNEAIKNNIEVYSIPGASAVITALTVSGFLFNNFAFYGFLNRESKKLTEDLTRVLKDTSNLAVIYESPKRILKTLEKISSIMGNPHICLCNDLTKKFEKKYYGTTSEVLIQLQNNPNYELGEYVVVIEKNKVVNNDNCEKTSIESLLIDTMIKKNCTMKDAIKIVSENTNYNKNSVYNASLNIKKIFCK